MVHSSKSQSLPGYMFINDWLSCDLQCNMVFTMQYGVHKGTEFRVDLLSCVVQCIIVFFCCRLGQCSMG